MYNFKVIDKECISLFNNIKLNELKNKNILVTGANGLIGGFLSDFFNFLNIEHNFKINLFLTSYSSKDKLSRIKHIVDNNKNTYFSWDCSERVNQLNLPDKLDYVFFCSGYGQPSKFVKNNIKTILINTVGLESLLDYMNRNGGGNLLFLSSSEIYGNPPDEMIPTPEEFGGLFELYNNRASYKESKKIGEVICKEYNKLEHLNTKVARVALTYGPGALLDDERVLQEFIFKSHNDSEIKMLDEGFSIRKYLYITDSIEILLNIILNGKKFVYNVGGDTEAVSIYDLASIIAEQMQVKVIKGSTTNKTHKSAPKSVGLSMKRYQTEFRKNKNIDLKTGIQKTIEWFNLRGKK
jgi:UDP-glucuronate decarboxylase